MDWRTCNHKWKDVVDSNEFFVRDECEHCGSIGQITNEPDGEGYYKIVAKPWADVIDINEYRKRKEANEPKEALSKSK